MKAISDVKMAAIVDRLVNLNQPFFTCSATITDEIYWSCDDQDLHDSVTEFDEKTGRDKRTRQVKYFDIWLWSDDDSYHHARVPVSLCTFTNSADGSRFCDFCIGYNARAGKSLRLRVGIDVENSWFIKGIDQASMRNDMIYIEAW